MKGSTWVFAIVTFLAAIVAFSRGYAEVVTYLGRPTPEGLVGIVFFLVVLVFLLAVLGFIMYAVDRRAGNVKNKVYLFERLLGFRKDAVLPENADRQQEEKK
jgi:TRAP-type C4-dicarboxylate transport system permease small subunit